MEHCQTNILLTEEVLLEALCFDFVVESPHAELVDLFDAHEVDALVQEFAWSLAHDSFVRFYVTCKGNCSFQKIGTERQCVCYTCPRLLQPRVSSLRNGFSMVPIRLRLTLVSQLQHLLHPCRPLLHTNQHPLTRLDMPLSISHLARQNFLLFQVCSYGSLNSL